MPRALILVARIHWIGCAPTTTVLRPRHINNPMRSIQRFGTVEEGLPIGSGRRRKDFGARRTSYQKNSCPSGT